MTTPLQADYALKFRAMLASIEEFCRRNAARVRVTSVALDYLTESLVFHATRGTLAVVWDGPRLAGVAIAWQTHRAHVLEAEADGKSVFNWQPSDPTGDCVYLALVAAEHPAAMKPLAEYFLKRNPHWATLPAYAHRRGKLKDQTGLLARLARNPH